MPVRPGSNSLGTIEVPAPHLLGAQTQRSTAMHVAAVLAVGQRLRPALQALRMTLRTKSEAVADIVKIGRTRLQEATLLMLGQVLQSLRPLADGFAGFDARCARGIEVLRAHIDEPAVCSLRLVTALAMREPSAAPFDAWVCPAQMVRN